MGLNWVDLSKIFKEKLYENRQYNESLQLTRMNTSGNLWLFGGAVYKTLSNLLYRTHAGFKDFDFFAEKISEPIQLIQNWKRIYGKFTNPKFRQIESSFELDIVPLNNIYHLKENSLTPNIDNFLKAAPLNIFSLLFDINNEQLIGESGKKALESRVVKINNLKSAEEMAKRYDTTIKEIIEKRAKELNFKAEYPY